ncbi:MAG: hypothetical protein WA688_07210 [Thermoplasmata archaeon]
MRPIALALFIPVYFVAVGLKVNLAFVVAHWPLLLGLIAAASAVKMMSLFPAVRKVFGSARAGPITVLMNSRLTSATVILPLVLGLGAITTGWYSIFISVVVVLALASSAAVRAFPGFRNVAAARELFCASDATAEPSPTAGRGSLPGPLDTRRP